jgi:hypothetical protein
MTTVPERTRKTAAEVAFTITANRGRFVDVLARDEPYADIRDAVLVDATRADSSVLLVLRDPRGHEVSGWVQDNAEILVDEDRPRACTKLGGHAPDGIHLGCVMR